MHIKCWQCGEDIDAFSAEKQIYRNIINDLRSRMCPDTVNDACQLWWKHDDCCILQNLIEEYKEKL